MCAGDDPLHMAVIDNRKRFDGRMDHFLGHQTVQNIVGLRFANRLFEPVWNSQHIERAEVLAAVATLTPEEVVRRTMRGRCGPGHINGVAVPGYTEEDGVAPERQTETYAQATLTIDNWRWAGVPFILRSGKALAVARRSIAVHFKDVPQLAFLQDQRVPPNVLELALQPDRVTLQVNVNGVGDRLVLETITLQRTLAAQELSAYARLLHDVLNGDASLSIRNDEVEESWRIVTPILAVWAEGRVPLVEYPAGSDGPPTRRSGIAPRLFDDAVQLRAACERSLAVTRPSCLAATSSHRHFRKRVSATRRQHGDQRDSRDLALAGGSDWSDPDPAAV